MKDEDKTKEKLIRELTDLHRRLNELESSETRQKEMLRDLRKSEERYRLLVESSSDFIWEVDANGIYTYANSKVKDLLGYEPEEIIGKTPFDLMPAYVAERVSRLFKDIFESQKPFQELENTNLHKDGHHVVLDTSGTPIFDTNGNLSGYRGIDRDISERKKIEEEMKDTKEFSDNIIESSLDCIVISDRRGCLTRVNKYFLEILGYKEEEVLAKHIAEFAPPEEGTYELITGELINIDKDFFENQLSMMCLLVEEGKVSNWDAYYCRKDGKLIPVEQNIAYLYNEHGEKTGAVGISRGVTERRKAERDQRETKAFLDNIIDSSQDCIIASDIKGNLTRVNKFFLELLGYKEKEVLGKHITEFTPLKEGVYESSTGTLIEINKEFFDRSYSMVTTLLDVGKITNRETYFLTKHKKVIPVEENIVYLYNDEGKRIGAVGVFRDTTVRKQVEEQLKETTAFLDNIIESSLDCVIATDKGGYLTRVNRYFLELLGYKEEEVLGRHTSEFAPQRDISYEATTGEVIKIDTENYDNVMAAMSRLVEEGKLSNLEFYLLRKDKKAIPVEENIVYLYDESGATIGAVGILRNVTERKKAEKEIIEARDFLENIFKTSIDGIITTDYKGNITMVNKAVEEILGYSRDELVGKHTREFGQKRGDYKERIKEFFATIKEKGFISEFEYVWLKKGGKEVDIELNAAMLSDSKGEFSGVVSNVRDITERKKIEKRLNEHQNQLRSLASQLTLTEERARRRIATDLHDRIGQALAMSKIKLGSLRESASSIGLGGDIDKIRDIIEKTIQDTRSLIFDICPPLLYELGFEKAVEWLLENIQEEHGINALFEDDGIPKPLDDDIRVLLYQTVRELLVNVVKHAQAKKVVVSFKGNRGHIKISVEDDGIGFDTSKISSRVGKPEGFGLFRIVERLHYLGGEIQFESKPHHGTKISMMVPTGQSE